MIIVGCSGKKGSGKSTLGNYLKIAGFSLVSFADQLKHLARYITGMSIEHTDGGLKETPCNKLGDKTPREFMIDFGQLMRKYSFKGRFWLDYAMSKIKKDSPDLVYIPDVRFKNEADTIREAGGIIVRLERDPRRAGYTPSDDISETDLDDYEHFSLVLPEKKNNNPQDLETFAYEIREFVSKDKNKS